MYFYEEIVKKTSDEDKLRVPLPQSEIFHLENWRTIFKKLLKINFILKLKKMGAYIYILVMTNNILISYQLN